MLSNVILLSQLDEQKDYERVTVTGKVFRVQDPVKVSPVLRKQNITIADSSAAAKLTLWENSINKLSLHKSYRFSQFTVRTYKSAKYLSLPWEGGAFEKITDIYMWYGCVIMYTVYTCTPLATSKLYIMSGS